MGLPVRLALTRTLRDIADAGWPPDSGEDDDDAWLYTGDWSKGPAD